VPCEREFWPYHFNLLIFYELLIAERLLCDIVYSNVSSFRRHSINDRVSVSGKLKFSVNNARTFKHLISCLYEVITVI